ncbi:hypothetical protein [Phenylobacterium sp. SCN 70-31]|uniref:hypothetical protein n=1 Tax=Phenylobacterium sp. SCN 70-31 TaxID=1660129 RepID=UPI0025F2F2D7|nr:hypothetical protein [Phenylobacterium sp. SCN 70-31]
MWNGLPDIIKPSTKIEYFNDDGNHHFDFMEWCEEQNGQKIAYDAIKHVNAALAWCEENGIIPDRFVQPLSQAGKPFVRRRFSFSDETAALKFRMWWQW